MNDLDKRLLKRRLLGLSQNVKYGFRLHKPRLTARLAWATVRTHLFRRPPLRYVDFAIDFACNLRCAHCFAASLEQHGRRRMRVEDYQRVAAECMRLGAVNFSFQGGEPLLSPDLGSIIMACQPTRNVISVSTNGVLLTKNRIADLRSLGVDILTVSLDSSIPGEHDRFRGVPGTFHKTLAGIREALAAGLRVTLGAVVTHQNLMSEGITGLIQLAMELKIILYFILPVSAGRWKDNSTILLSRDDMAYIDSLTHTSPYVRTDLQANLGGYGCGAAKEILYLTPYGDVLTCPFLHVSPGNIFEDSIAQIRVKALQNPYFAVYHEKCLVSSDEEFIRLYLNRTSQADQLPLPWDEVFPVPGGN